MSWETIRNLIHDEWVILLLLLVWSVAGVAVICERIYSLWGVLAKSEGFKTRVIEAVEKGDLAKATALCETSNDPLGEVFGRGLRVFSRTPQKTTEAVSVPARRRGGRIQALPVGAWHRRIVGAVRRPVRHRGRHPQGFPVDVARRAPADSRSSHPASRRRSWPPRPASRRHRRHRHLQLLHRAASARIARAVQAVLRGVPARALRERKSQAARRRSLPAQPSRKPRRPNDQAMG